MKKEPISPSESSFPGLIPAASTGVKSQYEEIQDDELIALESIYGEDFGRLEMKGGAWKARLSNFDAIIENLFFFYRKQSLHSAFVSNLRTKSSL